MGLEDLARFLAPKRPRNAMKLLRCFYGVEGNKGRTMRDMMSETGLREKTLRYYLTKFKRWKLLWTERRYCQPAIYYLEPRAFRVRLDTVLIDPLRTFVSLKPWRSGEAEAEA